MSALIVFGGLAAGLPTGEAGDMPFSAKQRRTDQPAALLDRRSLHLWTDRQANLSRQFCPDLGMVMNEPTGRCYHRCDQPREAKRSSGRPDEPRRDRHGGHPFEQNFRTSSSVINSDKNAMVRRDSPR